MEAVFENSFLICVAIDLNDLQKLYYYCFHPSGVRTTERNKRVRKHVHNLHFGSRLSFRTIWSSKREIVSVRI